MSNDGAVPTRLLAVAPPWDRTALPWDPDLKATRDAVQSTLDALDASLELIAGGFDLNSDLEQYRGLPRPLLESAGWRNVLADAMPTLRDITWRRLREATSPTVPQWRAACPEDLTEEHLALLARWWLEYLLTNLMARTSSWLEHALPRAARADQIARSGELLTTYFPITRSVKTHLVSMVSNGMGTDGIAYFQYLETDPRLDAANRLWMEKERRTLQGERPSSLPDFLWLLRGRQLAQIRQLYCLADWDSPRPEHPLELTFDDDTAIQIDIVSNKMRIYEGAEEFHWEAPRDYPKESVLDHRYMVDRSDEPQVWPTIARELTGLEPRFGGPHDDLTGADFYFGDILMAVREVGSGTEDHTIEVGWTTVEPPAPDE